MATVSRGLTIGARVLGLNLPQQLPNNFKLDLGLVRRFGLPVAKASIELFNSMNEIDPVKCLLNLDRLRIVLRTVDSSSPIYLDRKYRFVMQNGSLHTLSVYSRNSNRDIHLIPYQSNGTDQLTNGLNQQKLLAVIGVVEKCFHLPANLQLQLALERSKAFVQNSKNGIPVEALINASSSLKTTLDSIAQEKSRLLSNGHRAIVIEFLEALKTHRQHLNGETPQFNSLCEAFEIRLS